jgi:hypothetical protein
VYWAGDKSVDCDPNLAFDENPTPWPEGHYACSEPRLFGWVSKNSTDLTIPPFQTVMTKQRICVAAGVGFLMAFTGPGGYANNKYFPDQYSDLDKLTPSSHTFPAQQTGQRAFPFVASMLGNITMDWKNQHGVALQVNQSVPGTSNLNCTNVYHDRDTGWECPIFAE